jgi:hypothetical protein
MKTNATITDASGNVTDIFVPTLSAPTDLTTLLGRNYAATTSSTSTSSISLEEIVAREVAKRLSEAPPKTPPKPNEPIQISEERKINLEP